MTKRTLYLVAVVLTIGLAFGPKSWAQSASPAATSSPGSTEGVRSITVITIHGKVAEVDRAEKLVTLEGPNGGRVTVRVENPYNLKAAKVGEPVVVRYYEVVTIRKKKPGETMPTASLQGGIATAKPGGVPGAVAELQGSLLVTVDAIDEAKGTVTVKAPDGTVERVKARNPQNLKRLKVGDELVITLARAIAVSLKKEPAS
jgi:hypothetical protein